jgi:hypothetical protein
MQVTPEYNTLVKLTTEYWHLLKTAERVLADKLPERSTGISAQVRYSAARLHAICAECGLRLVSYDSEPYQPNLPVTISNADEAASFEDMVIDRTIEPTIIADGQVVAMGKVLLRKRA